MIKIRLQRHGARHAPFYRMVVTPVTTRRDGKFIEVLGTYNPQAHVRTEELKLKMERIDHWLGVGAQPTDTAKSLIRQGRLSPEDWLKRSERDATRRLARAQKDKVPEVKLEDVETVKEEKQEEAVAPESKSAESESIEKAEEVKAEDAETTKEEKQKEVVATEAKSDESKPLEKVEKVEPEKKKKSAKSKEVKVEDKGEGTKVEKESEGS